MNRIIVLAIALTLIGCQAYAQNPVTAVNNRLEALSPEELKSKTGLQTLINALRIGVAPVVKTAEKKEAESIANIFSDLLNDRIAEPTVWTFQDATIRFHELMVRIDPADFENHYDLLDTYMRFATQKYFVSDSYGPDYPAKVDKEVELLKRTTMRKAYQLAKDYPKEADAYGALAYALFDIEKDAVKARAMVEKCLSIDKTSVYCKELSVHFGKDRGKK